MKKILFTIFAVVALGIGASAQRPIFGSDNNSNHTDGFFTQTLTDQKYRDISEHSVLPFTPETGYYADQDAVPTGSGLLLLAGMGAAYALRKRKKA